MELADIYAKNSYYKHVLTNYKSPQIYETTEI